MTTYARGRGSGIVTEGKYAHIWTFRDGKAIRIEGFIDWASARARAKLEE
jgi:ketosteroid isomerase-like protein